VLQAKWPVEIDETSGSEDAVNKLLDDNALVPDWHELGPTTQCLTR
jgi:hypothetical protein